MRRAAYGDGLAIRLTPIGGAPAREFRSPYAAETSQSAYRSRPEVTSARLERRD